MEIDLYLNFYFVLNTLKKIEDGFKTVSDALGCDGGDHLRLRGGALERTRCKSTYISLKMKVA